MFLLLLVSGVSFDIGLGDSLVMSLGVSSVISLGVYFVIGFECEPLRCRIKSGRMRRDIYVSETPWQCFLIDKLTKNCNRHIPNGFIM